MESLSRSTTAIGALLLFACSGSEVGWRQDIAPIVEKRCVSCHASGGIGPFPLDSYEAAAPLADLLLGAVESGTMPPWLAQETDDCQPKFSFKDDLRVTEEERAQLAEWVALGAPEGNGEKPQFDSSPILSVESPSATVAFRSPYTVEGTKDDFQCFVIDPGIDEKVWVTQAQLIPDNERVAHHGLVLVDLNGESEALADESGRFDCFNTPDLSASYLMMTWTPGAAPNVTPAGSGMPLTPGSRLVVQMHYHPTGQPEQDQSALELKWITREPEMEAAQALVGNYGRLRSDGTGLQPGQGDGDEPRFLIPANNSAHIESMIYRQDIPFEFPLFSVGTHMHYVGVGMRIELKREGQEKECLIETPKWDFDWQRTYSFDAPRSALPVIGPGDELHMRCVYDNSMSNPLVRRALLEQGLEEPVDVALGEETLDEMCLGIFGLLVPPGLLEVGF